MVALRASTLWLPGLCVRELMGYGCHWQLDRFKVR
ncbi:MAG: hypothetical protein ACI86X_001876 [Moritella sp.]|jgi:hypothetical protein